jgi:hypothetical protein
MNDEKYWEIRAEKYDKLLWPKNYEIMRDLIHFS